MGYRNYIGKISKFEYEAMKDLTYKELCEKYAYKSDIDDDDYGYVSFRNFITEIYELGKYVDSFPNHLLFPYFTREDVEKRFNSDTELKVVNKEFFMCMIKRYEGYIKAYYEKMLKPFTEDEKGTVFDKFKTDYEDEDFIKVGDLSSLTKKEINGVYELYQHVKSMASEWRHNFAIELDAPDDGPLSKSWKYEYSIFELFYLYKTFNWEDDLLVWYGH